MATIDFGKLRQNVIESYVKKTGASSTTTNAEEFTPYNFSEEQLRNTFKSFMVDSERIKDYKPSKPGRPDEPSYLEVTKISVNCPRCTKPQYYASNSSDTEHIILTCSDCGYRFRASESNQIQPQMENDMPYYYRTQSLPRLNRSTTTKINLNENPTFFSGYTTCPVCGIKSSFSFLNHAPGPFTVTCINVNCGQEISINKNTGEATIINKSSQIPPVENSEHTDINNIERLHCPNCGIPITYDIKFLARARMITCHECNYRFKPIREGFYGGTNTPIKKSIKTTIAKSKYATLEEASPTIKRRYGRCTGCGRIIDLGGICICGHTQSKSGITIPDSIDNQETVGSTTKHKYDKCSECGRPVSPNYTCICGSRNHMKLIKSKTCPVCGSLMGTDTKCICGYNMYKDCSIGIKTTGRISSTMPNQNIISTSIIPNTEFHIEDSTANSILKLNTCMNCGYHNAVEKYRNIIKCKGCGEIYAVDVITKNIPILNTLSLKQIRELDSKTKVIIKFNGKCYFAKIIKTVKSTGSISKSFITVMVETPSGKHSNLRAISFISKHGIIPGTINFTSEKALLEILRRKKFDFNVE